MRERDLPGYVSEWQGVDVAVIRAQRQAELANLAEYRARKVQAYKDWADPVKREAMKATAEAQQAAARQAMAGKYIDDYRVRTVKDDYFIGKSIDWVPLAKPHAPAKRWWHYLIEWFEAL